MIRQFSFIAVLCCAAAHAQPQPSGTFPTAFPPDAKAPEASALAERLRGQVFTAKLTNGTGLRLEYQSSGYAFADISNGARDNGKWRTEDGRVCVEYVGRFPSGCAEVRVSGDTLYYKSYVTGEVVVIEKK